MADQVPESITIKRRDPRAEIECFLEFLRDINATVAVMSNTGLVSMDDSTVIDAYIIKTSKTLFRGS
jgi:hypothetical protein